MKAWVTGEQILIHAKYQQPYLLKNTTHWVQMANDKSYVPIFPGDTRVVMMYVPMLDGAEIPKDTLLTKLKEEASAFLRTLLDLKLPAPPGRLRLPVIETESKRQAEESVNSMVYKFVEEKCHRIDGAYIKLKDFYEAFREWLPKDAEYEWTYNRVIDEFRLHDLLPFGRYMNNITCVGNISLEPRQEDVDYGGPFIRFRQKLVKKD
jgi:phage/plasmid-associated DNA primase